MKKFSRYLKKAYLLLSILVLSFCWLAAQTFVIKREKSAPSRTSLKETCCQEWGKILQVFPQVLKKAADIQETGLRHVYDFLQSDKNSRIERATKPELQKMVSQLQTFNERLQNVVNDFQQQITFFQSLEKKNLT